MRRGGAYRWSYIITLKSHSCSVQHVRLDPLTLYEEMCRRCQCFNVTVLSHQARGTGFLFCWSGSCFFSSLIAVFSFKPTHRIISNVGNKTRENSTCYLLGLLYRWVYTSDCPSGWWLLEMPVSLACIQQHVKGYNTWAQESTTTVNGGEKEWAGSRYIPAVPHPLPSSLPPPHEDHSTRWDAP